MEKDEKLICYLDAILAEKKIKGQRITKTYLAKQLGVTKQFLTAVAKSKSNSSMSLKNSLRLARLLNVSVHDLWKLETTDNCED
jgi:DNA-binding XRE family transcriptional regulator